MGIKLTNINVWFLNYTFEKIATLEKKLTTPNHRSEFWCKHSTSPLHHECNKRHKKILSIPLLYFSILGKHFKGFGNPECYIKSNEPYHMSTSKCCVIDNFISPEQRKLEYKQIRSRSFSRWYLGTCPLLNIYILSCWSLIIQPLLLHKWWLQSDSSISSSVRHNYLWRMSIEIENKKSQYMWHNVPLKMPNNIYQYFTNIWDVIIYKNILCLPLKWSSVQTFFWN